MDVIDAPAKCERVKGTTYLVKGVNNIWSGTRWNCIHNKQKAQCRDCGGSAFCKHNKWKAQCRECGGSAFCKHNKWKSNCRECGGSAFCKHNKWKARCRDCNTLNVKINKKQIIPYGWRALLNYVSEIDELKYLCEKTGVLFDEREGEFVI